MRREFAISGPYRAEIDYSEDGDEQTVRFDWNGETLSFREVFQLWQTSAAFADFYVSLMRSCEYEGYVWELPEVSDATIDQPFEYTITEAGPFFPAADVAPFALHLAQADGADVIGFENLSRDAHLIVPVATGGSDFRDMKRFLANADAAQIVHLWQCAGREMLARLAPDPVWLSVNGAGVAWLHLRLDSWPKYYFHTPYCSAKPRP